MALEEELKKRVKGDVLTDETTLDAHSRDASLFVVRPSAVVFPKNTRDLGSLVRFVKEKKEQGADISLTARAAGTDMTGGPLTESIVVGFERYFNHVKSVNPSDKTAIAEPGVFYRDFEKETLAHDLLLPSYPASRELCALGGMISNNSAGEKTLRYGKIIDFVRKLRVVLSDGNEYVFEPLGGKELQEKLALKTFEGEIYKNLHWLLVKNWEEIQKARPTVSKNSAGYNLWEIWDREHETFDLTKLFVGAQGTLGLITEATFRLVKTEKESRMAIIFLDELDELGHLVNTVLEYGPESFESYDDHTLRLALRFFPSFAKRLGTKGFLSIAWRFLPELFMVLRGGIPKLVLQAEFSGNDARELDERVAKLKNALGQYHIRKIKIAASAEEAKKYWLIRRESFSLLRERIKDKKTAPFIDDIVVDPKTYPEFLPKLNAILEKYDITYTIAGHIGNGNFHIIPLMNLSRAYDREIIPKLSKEVYDLTLEYGGSITGEHNDGLIRTPFLEQMFGETMCRLFAETKKIFDPQNIFNPRKKVGGDLTYALEHIRKE